MLIYEVTLSKRECRRKEENATVHAFSHALSVVLVYLRDQLDRGPLSNLCIPVSSKTLSGTWLYYGDLEEIVFSLASLCQRVRSVMFSRLLLTCSIRALDCVPRSIRNSR
jgi:hypothetical protein